MKAKALVTGASGFTGSHLVKRLVSEGYEVYALVRKESSLFRLKNVRCKFVYGDIRDRKAIETAVKGKDIIFHLAAAWQNYDLTDRDFFDINVTGTRNLLDAALKSKVKKFIHTSTAGVLGDVKEIPANEQTPYNPGYAYQTTKMKGELLALDYHKKRGLPVVVIRPCGIYGPGDMRFLKLFKALKKRTFFMIGSGKKLYHPVYIDNLVEGYLLAATKKQAIGRVYLITDKEPVEMNHLVATIAKELGVQTRKIHIPLLPVYIASVIIGTFCKLVRIPAPIEPRRLDPFVKTRSFDISRAERELGYTPKIKLEEGIRRTAKWYCKEGLL